MEVDEVVDCVARLCPDGRGQVALLQRTLERVTARVKVAAMASLRASTEAAAIAELDQWLAHPSSATYATCIAAEPTLEDIARVVHAQAHVFTDVHLDELEGTVRVTWAGVDFGDVFGWGLLFNGAAGAWAALHPATTRSCTDLKSCTFRCTYVGPVYVYTWSGYPRPISAEDVDAAAENSAAEWAMEHAEKLARIDAAVEEALARLHCTAAPAGEGK